MGKDVNKRKSIRSAKLVTELCISAVIVAIAVYSVKITRDRITIIESSDYVKNTAYDTVETATDEYDPDKIIFESAAVDTKSKFQGDLILVNSDYQYFSGDEELVGINELLDEEERTSYRANDYDLTVVKSVYTPMSEMFDAFNAATGYDDIIVLASYRTSDEQKELYDEDLEETGNDTSTKVAIPGHSEHESGYAVDLTTSTTWDYDGTGEYDWINQNCWKYGFILRYTEDKTSLTGIQSEPWHYRYVGIPHAYYMYTNDLCLEEYIDLVREHPYDGEHLEFTDGNGDEYEVYFVASDDGADSTILAVPSNRKYEISGNNVDGFIVTVYKDVVLDDSVSDDEQPTEETTEEETDSSEEDSEDEFVGEDA
jgi:D-alanyl-D-alanine carboxypeptidase